MGYKLKPGQEEFTIIDGPLAGRYYKKGYEYPNAPAGYESRFERVGSGYEEDAEAADISKLYARRRKTSETDAEVAVTGTAEVIPATESVVSNEGAE